MQKSNGGKAVDERFLFHGTSKKYIDAICQQNFDWRICGIHGTVYGKGCFSALSLTLDLLKNSQQLLQRHKVRKRALGQSRTYFGDYVDNIPDFGNDHLEVMHTESLVLYVPLCPCKKRQAQERLVLGMVSPRVHAYFCSTFSKLLQESNVTLLVFFPGM